MRFMNTYHTKKELYRIQRCAHHDYERTLWMDTRAAPL
ncbi:hypothetical protein AFE_0766 [Acidithiobacillus ferrooxidans ATCC 23270]|uniref:Uncharacterized protein n=1 Tax=Acidithiobacillus ferrooxidans (strain ATCC 23270 / DSM 14882 / CIP 104768 / NCIMB 8455) TaxID=243159 RepID=B7J6I2_ACIF2|nr:hypothetical protein AFE_0766 [Acidithiobacillus ferrooxidans ATCC 23270]